MIYELLLVLCLSQNECITIKQQLSGGDCVVEAGRNIEKYGYDPDDPPYLRSEPTCTKIYEGDNVRHG